MKVKALRKLRNYVGKIGTVNEPTNETDMWLSVRNYVSLRSIEHKPTVWISYNILCILDRASLWQLKNKRPTWCLLLFYFTSYLLNMFRTLIYPSSWACDYSVELPHWSYCSWFDVCWSFGVVGLEWYPCCRLQPVMYIGPWIIVIVEE